MTTIGSEYSQKSVFSHEKSEEYFHKKLTQLKKSDYIWLKSLSIEFFEFSKSGLKHVVKSKIKFKFTYKTQKGKDNIKIMASHMERKQVVKNLLLKCVEKFDKFEEDLDKKHEQTQNQKSSSDDSITYETANEEPPNENEPKPKLLESDLKTETPLENESKDKSIDVIESDSVSSSKIKNIESKIISGYEKPGLIKKSRDPFINRQKVIESNLPQNRAIDRCVNPKLKNNKMKAEWTEDTLTWLSTVNPDILRFIEKMEFFTFQNEKCGLWSCCSVVKFVDHMVQHLNGGKSQEDNEDPKTDIIQTLGHDEKHALIYNKVEIISLLLAKNIIKKQKILEEIEEFKYWKNAALKFEKLCNTLNFKLNFQNIETTIEKN